MLAISNDTGDKEARFIPDESGTDSDRTGLTDQTGLTERGLNRAFTVCWQLAMILATKKQSLYRMSREQHRGF